MRKLMIGGMTILMFSLAANGQNDFSIDDYLESYIGENAVEFIQPLADMYTSSINTGVWSWAKIDKKLYVQFKANGMISYPTESMRTFVGTTTGDFRPQQSAVVPTIIGDKTSVVVYGEENSVYVFPGGYDLKKIILGTPQLTVGGFFNTEVSVRYVTIPLGNDLGSVNFYGIGGRHSLSNYFNESPVDFSIGYMYQKLDAEEYIQSDQHFISGTLGKTTKFFSGHILVGYQSSDSDLHYAYEDGDDQYDVNLNINNSNPWLIEAGIGLRLKPLMISGAISCAGHTTVTAGVGLTF